MINLKRTLFDAVYGLAVLVMAMPSSAQELNGMPDINAGRSAFNLECASCHSLDAGKVLKGPSLKAVYGRRVASESGFAYSAALTKQKGVWTEDTLDNYLRNPTSLGTGVNMVTHGLVDTKMRQDVIGFLKHNAR